MLDNMYICAYCSDIILEIDSILVIKKQQQQKDPLSCKDGVLLCINIALQSLIKTVA